MDEMTRHERLQPAEPSQQEDTSVQEANFPAHSSKIVRLLSLCLQVSDDWDSQHVIRVIRRELS
ncbi:hypothetical protein CERSUDRAFT_81611 [Gelatoporia subvermispora B]|uniref:Uncharacterized protein n=1 Tax=Ceriporiopsis subvermispora (strain B) TaxID=914234 RepID=M2QP07_CERS8|nr:hypothetical protein CERSUDRAFT_81611 [Gelatoporia subvermispora B]